MRIRTAIPVGLALCGLAALMVAPTQAPAPSESTLTVAAVPHGDSISAALVASYAHDDGHDHSHAAPLATRLPKAGRSVGTAVGSQSPTSYKITVPNANGQYLAWNKCQTIRWAIDPTNLTATKASLVQVKKAAAGLFAEIASHNGYKFEYAGERPGLGRQAGPNDFSFPIGPGSANPDVHIIIGYNSHSKAAGSYYSALMSTATGAAAGLGSPTYTPTATGPYWASSGAAIINFSVLAKFPFQTHVDVLRHELGHVMGLDHFEGDNRQVMYPVVQVSKWGLGDIGGLKALAQVPCPA